MGGEAPSFHVKLFLFTAAAQTSAPKPPHPSFSTSVPSERHLMAINFPAVTLEAAPPGFKNETNWRLSRHVSHHNDNIRLSENGSDAG